MIQYIQLKDSATGAPVYPITARNPNEIIMVECGGTGANNIKDARSHLEVYSKTEVDTIVENIDISSELEEVEKQIGTKVPLTRTINGKDLTADIILTPEDIGVDSGGAADKAVAAHNSSNASHTDIRLLITELTNRLNSLADSDDTTLDQLSEIVAYIQSNRDLIESITTEKINVADIVDNCITAAANKPLSANQGKYIKGLIDALESIVSSNNTTVTTNLNSHINNKSNPHAVTKAQIGLGNVDNTADSAKSVKYATTAGGLTGVTATAAELNYLNGIESNVQTQLDGRSLVGHTHNNYASTVNITGSGNAITSLSQAGNVITATKGTTFLTAHPAITMGTNTTSAASPGAGETFTAIDSITKDAYGHVTKVNTKTISMPTIELMGESLLLKAYPIGSIYMSVVNTNPGALFGGTWEAWGAGRVAVGVDTSNANFATVEYSGGSADAIVVEHTHAQVEHTHTVGNQSANHTHAQVAHTHTVGTQSANHTHTANSAGAHTHGVYNCSAAGSSSSQLESYAKGNSANRSISTKSAGAHTHSTTVNSANHTHAVSGGATTTGANSANHNHAVTGGATTTGEAGSAGTGKNLQPYITCYMWKRVE